MRVFVSTMIFLACVSVMAQADLTRADFYQPGDNPSYLGVDVTGVDVGPAGNGVTWDFSGLPRVPDSDYSVSYDAASAGPAAGQFPNANMVAIQDAGPANAYTYFQVSDSLITVEGLDIPDVGILTYSDVSEYITLPFGFNDTHTDDFQSTWNFEVNGIPGVGERTGTATTTFDGYGTIILPNGERIENVRRIYTDQVVNDAVTSSGFTVNTRVHTRTYNFYAVGTQTEVFHYIWGETFVDIANTTTVSVQAAYLDKSGGTTTPTTFAPRGSHLTTQGGDFDSEILVHNAGSAATLTLTPYDNNGQALTNATLDLPAGGSVRTLQNNLFPAEAKSFSTSGCDDCRVSIGYRASGIEDASTAQVHQSTRYDEELIFYPGEWSLLFDGAAIINAGDANAEIVAERLDDSGNVLESVPLETALEPGGKHLTIFNNLFNDASGVVKVRSTEPMTAMILRISTDGRFLYENLPIPGTPTNGDRWIAHITSDTGGFDTDIYAHNFSSEAQTVQINPFDSDGNALAPLPLVVEANSTRRFAKSDFLGSTTSHASITGSTDVLVTVGYRSQLPDSSTAPIHEAPATETTFYLYPGEWDVLFDGLAMVNTGSGATDITVTQLDGNGNAVASETLVSGLAPNAKFLGILESSLPDNPDTIIRVDSTEPLAVLVLRLSKDSRYLYGNNPLPK